jgi:hypothetical protein
MRISGYLHAPAVLLPGKIFLYIINRGLGDPSVGLTALERR